MAWTAPRTWVTGEVVTSTHMNTHVRDNDLQTAPALVTTAGDIVQATGANALARLGIGTALQGLQVNSGATALEYVELWRLLDRNMDEVNVVSDAAHTNIYSYTIPAGLLGTTGGFRCTIGGDALINVAGTIVLRVYLGATLVFESDLFDITNSASRYKWWWDILCLNNDLAAAQKWSTRIDGVVDDHDFSLQLGSFAGAFHGQGYNSSAENTAAALLFRATVDWSDASASLSWRKEQAILELIPPA